MKKAFRQGKYAKLLNIALDLQAAIKNACYVRYDKPNLRRPTPHMEMACALLDEWIEERVSCINYPR